MKKFTVDEINVIMFDNELRDDNDNVLFKAVSKNATRIQIDRASSNLDIVIQEVATGKFFKASLLNSQWIGQDEYNINVEWIEVFPKTITTTIYE